MEQSIKFKFLMSQLTHVEDLKETEKTKISVVYYDVRKTSCILRICKKRNLSPVCEALRKIRNPNTVVVYDYVYENGDTYILEENVDGETVEEVLEREGVYSDQKAAIIAIEICKALEDLHRERPPIIHNDINPSNIKIREDGSVKLFDFDISRFYKKGQSQNTVLFGTEEYASPEHFGYGQSEPRTDIYSLGVTMHKMLTGKGLSSEHKSIYDGKLKKIINSCLEIDPKNRYASVRALRKDLERFLSKKKRLSRNIFVSLGIVMISFAVLLYAGFLDAGNAENKKNLREPVSTQTVNKDAASAENSDSYQNVVTEAIADLIAMQGATAETTKNNSRENARPIVLNTEYSETIEEDGIADWYRFVTKKEVSVYRLYIRFDLGPYCPSLSLYDKDGIKVKDLEVYTSHNKEGFFDIYLNANEEYTVKVMSPQTVDYVLYISDRACDVGIDIDSATEIAIGEKFFATVNSTLSDWFVFTAIEKGRYVITCHNIDVGAPIKCYTNQDGRSTICIEAENENSFSNVITVEEGETVYIEVKSTKMEANGKYILMINPE